MEFIKIYEELNILNEAVSPEAQAFYKSLNNRYKNLVDTESFIKAFKKDIPDDIWDKLFNDNMKLKNRGTYGIIKNEPLPAEVTAALKKYWGYQFASNIPYFETTTMIAKEEAERKRKEDDCRLKIAETEQRFKTKILPLINKAAVEKLFNLYKEEQPTEAAKLSTEIRFVPIRVDVYGLSNYYGEIEACNISQVISYKASDQEVAEWFNNKVLVKIQELEETKAKRLALAARQEKYKNAKWYSEELEKWTTTNYKATYLFQLPDDEGVQRIANATWDKIERCSFSDDVELIAVIVSSFRGKSNPNSATQSEYSDTYYSVNSEGDHAETLEAEGIVLDPTKYEPMGQALVDDSYYEISVADAKNRSSYFKTGMNQWFHRAIIYYGTD